MIHRSRYYLRRALESMLRAPWLSLATIGMLALVFLLFTIFAVAAHNVGEAAGQWIGSVRMTVFLKPETTNETATRMAANLKARQEIQGVVVVTPLQAKERFMASFPGGKGILEGLPDNPLPASIEVELAPESMNLTALTKLSEEISQWPGVDEAVFGRELFAKLSAVIGVLRLGGLFLGFVFAVAVLFLTANTIRLNLYARRDEIEILQLVGATRWFVRWPFIIEGMIAGLSGAILALLACWFLFGTVSIPLSEALSGPFGEVSVVFLPLSDIALIALSGMALGGAGSFVTLGRYWRAI